MKQERQKNVNGKIDRDYLSNNNKDNNESRDAD